MIVGAQIFDERFVGLIVGAAAQLAILMQPSVDMHEKGYRQRWFFEHPPSTHHDPVREGLLAELAHDVGSADVAGGPIKRRQQIRRREPCRQPEHEIRISTEEAWIRWRQQRKDIRGADVGWP